VSLIGSNGAGKTTTMKAITGSLPLAGGDIEFWARASRARALGPGPAGPGHGARGPRRVHPHDHHREPADGRLHPQRQGGRGRDIEKIFTIFPRLRSARTSWPAPCPAASSRCWPWAAR
jgi:branched-chain amino acid transport system ATP-binding protein